MPRTIMPHCPNWMRKPTSLYLVVGALAILMAFVGLWGWVSIDNSVPQTAKSVVLVPALLSHEEGNDSVSYLLVPTSNGGTAMLKLSGPPRETVQFWEHSDTHEVSTTKFVSNWGKLVGFFSIIMLVMGILSVCLPVLRSYPTIS